MNTNATNLNREYRMLLGQFSNLNIICSIDGYDQVNRYIRWPADWPTLVENIKGLTEITPNVAFNVTVSIWNIARLSELVEFFEHNFPQSTVLLNKVMYPPAQMFNTFPDKELALQDLNKLTKSKYYANDGSFRSKVDYYIAEMQNAKLDLVALEQFFVYNDTLDRSREIRLVDYIPELESCRNYITNQI